MSATRHGPRTTTAAAGGDDDAATATTGSIGLAISTVQQQLSALGDETHRVRQQRAHLAEDVGRRRIRLLADQSEWQRLETEIGALRREIELANEKVHNEAAEREESLIALERLSGEAREIEDEGQRAVSEYVRAMGGESARLRPMRKIAGGLGGRLAATTDDLVMAAAAQKEVLTDIESLIESLDEVVIADDADGGSEEGAWATSEAELARRTSAAVESTRAAMRAVVALRRDAARKEAEGRQEDDDDDE